MRRWIPGALTLVLGVLMLVAVLLNFINVFSRYVLGSPIFWTEEVLVMITIWGVFLGAVVATWNGEHLAMDLFSSRLRGPARRVLNASIATATIAVCSFVAYQSYQIVLLFAVTEAVSVGAEIPKVIPHSALLLGFGLSALAVVLRIRSYLDGEFRR
jgi:TRAP-type transport system small permease protein